MVCNYVTLSISIFPYICYVYWITYVQYAIIPTCLAVACIDLVC